MSPFIDSTRLRDSKRGSDSLRTSSRRDDRHVSQYRHADSMGVADLAGPRNSYPADLPRKRCFLAPIVPGQQKHTQQAYLCIVTQKLNNKFPPDTHFSRAPPNGDLKAVEVQCLEGNIHMVLCHIIEEGLQNMTVNYNPHKPLLKHIRRSTRLLWEAYVLEIAILKTRPWNWNNLGCISKSDNSSDLLSLRKLNLGTIISSSWLQPQYFPDDSQLQRGSPLWQGNGPQLDIVVQRLATTSNSKENSYRLDPSRCSHVNGSHTEIPVLLPNTEISKEGVNEESFLEQCVSDFSTRVSEVEPISITEMAENECTSPPSLQPSSMESLDSINTGSDDESTNESEESFESFSEPFDDRLSMHSELVARQRLLFMLSNKQRKASGNKSGGRESKSKLIPATVSPSFGGIISKANEPSGSSSSSTQSNSVQSGPTQAAKLRGVGSRRENGEHEERDETEGNRKRKRPHCDGFCPTSPSSCRKKFACPYFTHGGSDFARDEVCPRGWPDLAKLKEHLYRRHYVEFQCQRCKANLHSRRALDMHAESSTSCTPKVRDMNDGFTFEVYLLLHNKRKSFRPQNDEDKWREIYQLIFPHATSIPSPFSDYGISSKISEIMTFEEYGDFEFPNKSTTRTVATVMDTTAPLHAQLLSQIPIRGQESEEAVAQKYQRMQDTAFQSLKNGPVPISSEGSTTHPTLPPGYHGQDRSDIGDPANASQHIEYESTFDSLFNGFFESPQHQINDGRSSDPGLASSSVCFVCIDNCICNTLQEPGLRSSLWLSQAEAESPIPTKDSDISIQLQNLTKLVLAMDKRLQAAENFRKLE